MAASVIAHGDTPPILEPSKPVFDLMPLFADFPVVFDLNFTVFLREDAGCYPFFRQRRPELYRILSPIRQAHLAFGQQQEDRPVATIARQREVSSSDPLFG